MTLKTKRLNIIPLKTQQLELLCTDENRLYESLKLSPRKETADEHLKAAYRTMLENCRKDDEKNYLWYTNWLIVLKDENTVIGSIGFFGKANEKYETEVGYGIDEAYRGNGYASEALKKISEWAFSKDVYFLRAVVETENTASSRVLEKCGFAKIGVTDDGEMYELERPKSSWMSIYMCFGMSLGLCFGLLNDKLSVGLPCGLAIGIAIGAALDAEDKKKRNRE